MGFLFISLLLMVVSVCPGRMNPIPGTNITLSMDSEHSGTGDLGNNFSEGFDGTRDSEVVWNSNPDFTSNDTVAPPEPSRIGMNIMEFINQHMISIIIAGVLLVLVVVSVCTAVLVRQNYKASAYYPASYPHRTYVDEQEKEGAVKAFSEISDQLGCPPRVEVVDCSSQLKADILAAAHSLKRKPPSKAEGDMNVETPAREDSGRVSQGVGQEEGDKAVPEVGGKEVEPGPKSKATDDNGDDARAAVAPGADGDSDQEGPTLSKEEEEDEKGERGEK
ncbi:transmembrane protein 119b, partial [Callorhinchus milii]|uniref:transmembrane protein 119b n=1 Tax=Callorhinchus milii TaxID=7868 RepID=UPI001C3FCB7C